MWSRVEGSRCDPNPNEEFSRPDGESLFGEDGKLTPSITILGRRKKDFGSQFRNIHGDMESSSIAFSRASRTLPGFLLFFTLSRLWLLVREKFSIDCGEQSGVGLVCFVSLSELSRKLAHFLDQSDSKWNQSRIVTRVFPRFGHLLDFCLRSHWLLWYFPLFWLVVVMTLVLTLRHSIEMRFTLKRLTGNYFGRAISNIGYDLKSLSGRIFLKFCILSSDDEDFSTIKLMIKPQLFFFAFQVEM